MAGAKGRSGGYRSGAGRKADPVRLAVLRGGSTPGVIRPHGDVSAVVMPALDEPLRAIWLDLAPHATKAGTLTPTMVPAFLRLCQAVVKHAEMEAQIKRDGLTYLKVTIDGSGQEHTEVKAHPLISRAETLDSKIRGWFKDFAINPFGKPLAEATAKPVDPFAEFEKGTVQ